MTPLEAWKEKNMWVMQDMVAACVKVFGGEARHVLKPRNTSPEAQATLRLIASALYERDGICRRHVAALLNRSTRNDGLGNRAAPSLAMPYIREHEELYRRLVDIAADLTTPSGRHTAATRPRETCKDAVKPLVHEVANALNIKQPEMIFTRYRDGCRPRRRPYPDARSVCIAALSMYAPKSTVVRILGVTDTEYRAHQRSPRICNEYEILLEDLYPIAKEVVDEHP